MQEFRTSAGANHALFTYNPHHCEEGSRYIPCAAQVPGSLYDCIIPLDFNILDDKRIQ